MERRVSWRQLVQVLLLTGMALLAFDTARAAGQSSGFQRDFEVCSTPVTPAEERQLRTEQRQYERRIATLQQKPESPVATDPKNKVPAEMHLQQVQAKLLRVLERLECKRLSELTDTVVRGPAAPKPNFVQMRVNYATDRLVNPEEIKAPGKDPSKHFLGALDPDFKDFSFGIVTVTIPTQRKPGELNLPSSWSFVQQPDPDRFFVIQKIDAESRADFMKQMNAPDPGQESSLLLFVHGFNVTFADAALRTAQLAHDLQFPGKVMLYSWPSAGDVAEYWKDEDSCRISTSRFRKLLADLLATKISRIYIVAHSMGTRIVIPTVTSLASRGADVSKLSELMLAAADFNEIEFKELASDFKDLRAKGTRVTIYESSNDFALQASRRIHSYRRLGESDPKLNTFTGLDSVDASTVAPMKRAYGHSYVCDSALVIGDMEDLVLKGLTPKDRGLVAVPDTSQFGWQFPK